MNCQNAQSMVLNFINNKLDKEETKAFIEHVRDCKDCWEELEIYYVMLVGLKQLDEGAEPDLPKPMYLNTLSFQ